MLLLLRGRWALTGYAPTVDWNARACFSNVAFSAFIYHLSAPCYDGAFCSWKTIDLGLDWLEKGLPAMRLRLNVYSLRAGHIVYVLSEYFFWKSDCFVADKHCLNLLIHFRRWNLPGANEIDSAAFSITALHHVYLASKSYHHLWHALKRSEGSRLRTLTCPSSSSKVSDYQLDYLKHIMTSGVLSIY